MLHWHLIMTVWCLEMDSTYLEGRFAPARDDLNRNPAKAPPQVSEQIPAFYLTLGVGFGEVRPIFQQIFPNSSS